MVKSLILLNPAPIFDRKPLKEIESQITLHLLVAVLAKAKVTFQNVFFSYSKNYVENGKCERLWNHLSRQVVIIMAVVTHYGKKVVLDKGNSMWATSLVATLYYEMPEAFVTSSLPKWSKSP